MTFDENGICVLESITTVEECEAYTEFLTFDEKPRHQADKYLAELRMTGALHHWQHDDRPVFWKAMMRFRDSAATRHQQDIDGIAKRLVEIAAHKAKLGGK